MLAETAHNAIIDTVEFLTYISDAHTPISLGPTVPRVRVHFQLASHEIA